MNGVARSRLAAFLDMLAAERGAARNTLDAYERDLDDYLGFTASTALEKLTADDIRGWLADLAARGLKASTAARARAGGRAGHPVIYTDG